MLLHLSYPLLLRCLHVVVLNNAHFTVIDLHFKKFNKIKAEDTLDPTIPEILFKSQGLGLKTLVSCLHDG